MKHFLRLAALLACLFASSASDAAVGTIYIDTGGCEAGSTTKCSGTTDSASASAKGAGSTITCSATGGVGALVPGCTITGTGAAAGQLGSIAVDGSQALYVNCATNSNQKIFWITAVDNTLGAISTISTVGTPITPTGCTAATSDWGIGGRMILTPANYEAGVRPGDTVIFNNSPATRTTAFITTRVAGDSTLGYISYRGKIGVLPLLRLTSGVTAVINASVNGQNTSFSNFELSTDGTGVPLQLGANGQIVTGVKVSKTTGSAACVTTGTLGNIRLFNSEFTGCAGDGITDAGLNHLIFGNYIHGNAGNGITVSTTSAQGIFIESNIISTNTGKGISISGAPTTQTNMTSISGNTIYNNASDGLNVADTDTTVNLTNNIFYSNGTAGGYNINWAAGNAELLGTHSNNVFFQNAGGATGNLLNLTANSTEFTTDPLFVNATGANFAIGNTSPAAASGTPLTWLGASTTSYPDIGAMQRQGGAAGSTQVFGQ